MAKSVDTCDQDAMPQGGYPANPNATGKVARGYQVYTSGQFDDSIDQQGEGQIHSMINDGYPYPDGYVIKGKGAK